MATKKNLWGELPSSQTRRSPYSILKEQANMLGEITNGLLIGEVKQLPRLTADEILPEIYKPQWSSAVVVRNEQEEGDFYTNLRIVAPALNHYKYSVVQVNYPIQFYPLTLIDLANGDEVHDCPDEEAFERALEEVLSSEKVRDVIEALLSQVRGE